MEMFRDEVEDSQQLGDQYRPKHIGYGQFGVVYIYVYDPNTKKATKMYINVSRAIQGDRCRIMDLCGDYEDELQYDNDPDYESSGGEDEEEEEDSDDYDDYKGKDNSSSSESDRDNGKEDNKNIEVEKEEEKQQPPQVYVPKMKWNANSFFTVYKKYPFM